MSEQDNRNASPGRRRLLKTLIISGSAIPTARILSTEWSRPVISAVVLPVHAQMTIDPDLDGEPNTGNGGSEDDPEL